MTTFQRVAHESGDGITIAHCFAGETRYWTEDGLKTLADTVGTTQRVLTNRGERGHTAEWVDAEVHEFGAQPLMKVTLRRNKRTKVIYATPEHRWLVRVRNDPNRREQRVVLTQGLKKGHRLQWLIPKSRIGASTPSQFGIAHGIVYGDGSLAAKGSVINLWGEKDAQLLRYFSESRTEPVKTPNGVLGTRVKDLPGFFKDRPSLGESIPYLYGWLAGYFAADGNITDLGNVTLDSARRENLEFVQLLSMHLGIATYDIREKQRQGYGAEESTLYSLQFVRSTLRPNFFLVKEHRERYDASIERGTPDRVGWTVESVEATDRVETVYCVVVPETENFVLDGLINVMNCPLCGSGQVIGRSDGNAECSFCNSAFMVRVQPMFSAFPQTVDGMPVQIPGMPAPTPGMAPGTPPGVDGDPGGEDGDGSPFEGKGEGSDDSSGGGGAGDGGKDSGEDGPPWAKSSRLVNAVTLHTLNGTPLGYEPYLDYLVQCLQEKR